MLLSEFKQGDPDDLQSETRIYLDEHTTDIVCYQYMFNGPNVISIDTVTMPIKEFASITKVALRAYGMLWLKSAAGETDEKL